MGKHIIGVWSDGEATVSKAVLCGFESHHPCKVKREHVLCSLFFMFSGGFPLLHSLPTQVNGDKSWPGNTPRWGGHLNYLPWCYRVEPNKEKGR